MKISFPRDIAGATLIVLLGILIIYWSSKLRIGSLSSMGPGYFPLMLGVALSGLGGAALVNALLNAHKALVGVHLRPVFFILFAIISFGMMINHLGLIISTMLTSIIAHFAMDGIRLRELVLVACFISAIIYVVFSVALSINIPPLPRIRGWV